MKRQLILLIVAFLGGCANFDPAAMQQALGGLQQAQSDQYQRNTAYNQQMRAQLPAPQPMGRWVLTNQSYSGNLHYCKYANGAVYTVNVTDQCLQMIP